MSFDPHQQPPALPLTPNTTGPTPHAPADVGFEREPYRPRVLLPLVLFPITCYTTYSAYVSMEMLDGTHPVDYRGALIYAAALMFILLCHELGHYLQARRYRVPASLPYFIPMPAGPFGTMGAVINMPAGMGDRKALFDIGISGPLAGLVPTLICCVVGLSWSTVVPPQQFHSGGIGAPLIFRILAGSLLPGLAGNGVELHPLAYAGWVGVFLTSVNLFPIGQLDGGHVLYAILREKAWPVAIFTLAGSIAAVVLSGRYEWSVMLALLLFIGPYHPPTANDNVPLGLPRIVLGWLTLAFVIIGFTPQPFGG